VPITKDWFKSSASTGANNCVEVRFAADGSVDVRNSKQVGVGPVVQFTADEWNAFITGAKVGEFDLA
jgi:hypothetical protein